MCGSLTACRTVLAGSPRRKSLQRPSERLVPVFRSPLPSDGVKRLTCPVDLAPEGIAETPCPRLAGSVFRASGRTVPPGAYTWVCACGGASLPFRAAGPQPAPRDPRGSRPFRTGRKAKPKRPSWNPCGPSRGGCGAVVRVSALPTCAFTHPGSARTRIRTPLEWSLRRGSDPHLRRSRAHNRGSRGTTSLTWRFPYNSESSRRVPLHPGHGVP